MRRNRFIISKALTTFVPILLVALLTANSPAGTGMVAFVSRDAQQMLPYINAGPDSGFAQIDFAQLYMDTGNKEQFENQEQVQQRKHMVEIGVISALDLDAPNKALEEYNRAARLMQEQKAQEAIIHLHKAIAAYPKFVLAYNALGLAYIELGDSHAKVTPSACGKEPGLAGVLKASGV